MKSLQNRIKSKLYRKTIYPDCFVYTNTVFVHIPKNAGQSIGHALYGMTIHHEKAADLRKDRKDTYSNAFSFAVVRDPISRFKSAYSYLKQGGRTVYDQNIADKYLNNCSLDEFITFLENTPFDENHDLFHFHTQTSYVCEPYNPLVIIVDRIYKLENLTALMRDFKSVTKLAPLLDEIPKVNTSKSGKLELTTEQEERIKQLYSIDYMNFYD
jgi:hypothetical protein